MTSKKRLLIIDDDLNNLKIIGSLLKEKYQVKASTRGDEGLTLAKRSPIPDLILLDIMMPDMDGYTVCQLLKDDPQTQTIPVIFLTAKNHPDDEAKGFQVGAVDFLTKPVNPPVLWARVETHLMLSQQRNTQGFISQVAARLLSVSASKKELAVQWVLESCVHCLRVDRGCFMLLSKDGEQVCQTYSWCLPGVVPQNIYQPNQALVSLPWWQQQIAHRHPITLSSLNDLPPTALAEKSQLQTQQTQSLIAYPLQKDSKVCGLICFETVHSQRNWEKNEIDLLEVIADISSSAFSRWQAEETLQEQNAKQQFLLQNINGISWEIDLASARFTYVSPNAERILGYPVDEWIDINSWAAMIIPEDRDYALSYCRIETTAGRDHNFDYRMRKKNGEIIWVLDMVTVVKNDLGQPVRLAGFILDNTERRRTEEALRESEQRLRTAGRVAYDLIYEWDVKTNRLEWFGHVDQILGYEDGVVSSDVDDWLALIHPDDHALLANAMHKHKSSSQPMRYRYRIKHKDGQYRYWQDHALPLLDDQSHPCKWIGVCTDITQQVQAERALLASEKKYRRLLETTTEGFWMLDQEFHIIEVNDSLCKMLDYSQQELLGRKPLEFADEESHSICRQQATQIAVTQHRTYEVTLLTKTGFQLPTIFHATTLKDDADQVTGSFAFITDIRQRKQAEKVILESQRKYKQLVEDIGPLTILFSYLPNGVITYISPTIRNVMQLESNEAIGQSFLNLVNWTPDSLDNVQTELHKILANQISHSDAEWSFIDAKQSLRTLHVISHAVRNEQGEVTHIEGVATDTTERKWAEVKLKQAASVFTHAREGITITDIDGNILEVNDAFTRITGHPRDQALGKNLRILKSGRHPPEFYTEMRRHLKEKGYWEGEIWNRRKNGELYPELLTISAVRNQTGTIAHYVSLFSDISAQKAYQKQLEHIAHHDALTNLPNRVLLADRMQQAMAQTRRRNQQLAVAYLDLDGFKRVNDQHGHDIGDQLLAALAKRMRQSLREGDTIARLGGDEFVAVLLDLESSVESQNNTSIFNRLLQATSQPIQIKGIELQISTSIGISFYPQAEEVDADQLLRQADQAMYQAKLAGKNRYHVFDPDHDRIVRGRHRVCEEVRHALNRREFTLYYQPKVNMHTGAVIGAEALIRWQHPHRGLLLPDQILPEIEGEAIALKLGTWVIDTVLDQFDRWSAQRLHIPISVNVSAHQLQQANFVQDLQQLLAAHPQVQPGDLELEVLETSALEDIAQVSKVIQACKEIGVYFALDDFGTGYSSLTYLKRLPATQLKIDRSFVRDMLNDPEDLAILEGVLGLATAFRRQAIAEGVETIEHGKLLLQLGCELAQGFGIARPMPADALPGWANTWQPDPSWMQQRRISRDDLPLLFAEVEHRAWIQQITAYLQGSRTLPPPLDYHQCRFGEWLKGEGKTRCATRFSFRSIELLHQKIHLFAESLIKLKHQGQNDQVKEGLYELDILRDNLLEKMKRLLQEKWL